MEILKWANLTLAFVLELCAVAAFGYWGFQAGGSPLAKWGLGIGASLLMIVVWGAFIAPKAAVAVPEWLRLVLLLLVFALASFALVATGQRSLGVWLFGVAVVNQILVYGLK